MFSIVHLSLVQSSTIEPKQLALFTAVTNSKPMTQFKPSGSICKIEPALVSSINIFTKPNYHRFFKKLNYYTFFNFHFSIPACSVLVNSDTNLLWCQYLLMSSEYSTIDYFSVSFPLSAQIPGLCSSLYLQTNQV